MFCTFVAFLNIFIQIYLEIYVVYLPSNIFGMWLPTPKTEMDGSREKSQRPVAKGPERLSHCVELQL